MKLLPKDVIANNPVLYFLMGFVAVVCLFVVFSALKDTPLDNTTILPDYLQQEDEEKGENEDKD
jgi:hypothetical protein